MKNKCLGKKCELNGFAVLDRVMVGAFVLGRDFKVLFWNRTLEDWTGVSKDKIVGADVAEYFPELKQPRYKHRIEDIFNGAPPAIFSPQLHGNFMPSKFSDGTNLVKRVTVSLVRINVTGGDEYEDNALFVMQDVSELTRRVSEYRLMHERVEKELALRKEAEGEVRKLSRAVEQSPATVVITDLDGRIEYVNPEFTRITGYSQEEVIGGNPQILKSGHTTDEEYKELWETITSGEIWEGEFLNVKKDGGHYWESAHIAPVKDDSGTITHFVAVKLDITERKKTEEVLKKTLNQQSVLNGVLATALKDISLEKQLELVLEKLFDLPWLPVLKRGCIFLVEESGTLTMKAHRGFSDSILNTCARIPFGKCLCGRAAESGKIVFAEAIDDRHEITYEGITPHGHYCVPIRSGENVLGVINLYVGEGHKWDEGEKKFLISIANTLAGIIEKKTAEEALRAAREEAEKATRTKDKFVALVSHDLKGPLHVIRGYLDMLKEGGLEPEVTKEMVLEAMSTCDDMNRFIKDILNLGRIKGGEIRPDRHFLGARDVADESMKNLTLLAKNKEVEIVNDIPKHMRIHADKELIIEVVSNLVSNAVKFCKKGDVVTLTSLGKDGHSIAVSDTGVGIEIERIDTLFKYEEKTSTHGTAGESGTGFGLPLAKDIVKAHGGKLSVKSAFGEGSTFNVSLPYRRPSILIIDDSETIREILKKLLEEMGVDIIEASSGEEAIGRFEGIKDTPIDLVLLDINMPGMSGFDVLKRIKNTSELKNIPVVIITGDDTVETRDSIFQLGADDFVVKPLKGEDLIPRLRRIIG